jgi:hypothetical protein
MTTLIYTLTVKGVELKIYTNFYVPVYLDKPPRVWVESHSAEATYEPDPNDPGDQRLVPDVTAVEVEIR